MMRTRLEIVLLLDRLLKIIDGAVGKLRHLATSRADEVMVMFSSLHQFETRNAVVKHHFTSQTAPGQKLHRPVYGCESDRAVSAINQPVDILRRDMVGSTQKYIQHQCALPGIAQSLGADKVVKDLSVVNIHKQSVIENENHFQ